MTRITWVVMFCLLTFALSAVRGQDAGGEADHHATDAASGVVAVTASAAGATDDVGCWEDYVARAIEIYLNLIDCAVNNEWYDWIGYLFCELSYEFGAVMALAKLLTCLSS